MNISVKKEHNNSIYMYIMKVSMFPSECLSVSNELFLKGVVPESNEHTNKKLKTAEKGITLSYQTNTVQFGFFFLSYLNCH